VAARPAPPDRFATSRRAVAVVAGTHAPSGCVFAGLRVFAKDLYLFALPEGPASPLSVYCRALCMVSRSLEKQPLTPGLVALVLSGCGPFWQTQDQQRNPGEGVC